MAVSRPEEPKSILKSPNARSSNPKKSVGFSELPQKHTPKRPLKVDLKKTQSLADVVSADLPEGTDDDELITVARPTHFSSPDLSINDADEQSRLLPKRSNVKWGGFLNSLKIIGSRMTNGFKWMGRHPLITVSSFITALPNGIMAFTPNPKELLNYLRVESAGRLTLNFLHAICSLMTNAILYAYFLAHVVDALKSTFKKMNDPLNRPKDFFIGLISLLLGVAAAIGAAAVTIKSFKWFPAAEFTAFVPAAFTLVVFFASRFVGTHNSFENIAQNFNEQGKLRRGLAHLLRRVNIYDKRVKSALEHKFTLSKDILAQTKHAHEQLTVTDLHNLVQDIYTFIKDHENDAEFMKGEGCKQLMQEFRTLGTYTLYCGLVLTFGVLPFTLMSWQNGNNGFGIIGSIIDHVAHFKQQYDQLPHIDQAAMSFITCMATFFLAGLTLFKLPQTTAGIINHLRKHPQDIPQAVLLGTVNGFAASSPWHLGLSIINEDNIFNLSPTTLGYAFSFFVGAVGTILNTVYTADKAGLIDKPAPANLSNLTLETFVKILNHPEPLSFFAKDQNVAAVPAVSNVQRPK